LVALYRAADILWSILPYRAITASGALATVLAFGQNHRRQAICSSFRELLSDREDELLVDPQDSTALAAALMELSGDFVLRQQLAANAQGMNIDDQSWLTIADRTRKCYEDLLD
jgi:hypothetical protein